MKALGALGLGLFSFFLFMFIGETFGLLAAFVALAIYFFLCQFLLSKRHADALREDWPVMLALDAAMLASFALMLVLEKASVILSQGPGILFATLGGTCGGAAAASLCARRVRARS